MKNQKGVTLISLTIYVIALTVIIAMLSIISTYFYKNVNDTQDDITPLTEYTNFNSYFTTDVNTTNIIYLTTGSVENDYSYIALVNKDTLNEENPEIIKYIYVKTDKTIYRNTEDSSIPVARNVDSCEFEEGVLGQNNKIQFNITLGIGNSNSRAYTYYLDND